MSMGKIIALILSILGISSKASAIKKAKVKKIDKKLKDSAKKIKFVDKKIKSAKKGSKNLKSKAANIEKEIANVKKGSKNRKEIKDSKDAEDFLRKFAKK
jgi:septal ring factor EnvC (AmiA/AmiB activator)